MKPALPVGHHRGLCPVANSQRSEYGCDMNLDRSLRHAEFVAYALVRLALGKTVQDLALPRRDGSRGLEVPWIKTLEGPAARWRLQERGGYRADRRAGHEVFRVNWIQRCFLSRGSMNRHDIWLNDHGPSRSHDRQRIFRSPSGRQKCRRTGRTELQTKVTSTHDHPTHASQMHQIVNPVQTCFLARTSHGLG